MFVYCMSQLLSGGRREEKQPSSSIPVYDEFGIEMEEAEPVDELISTRFHASANRVQGAAAAIPQESLIRLYGLYKRATAGVADSTERPSVFEVRNRAKFAAWEKASELDREGAMAEYTRVVEQILGEKENGDEPSGSAGKSAGAGPGASGGFGFRPSTMRRMSEDDFSAAATSLAAPDELEAALWFAASKADDVETTKRLLAATPGLLNGIDSTGTTALQWAVDSGAENTTRLLIGAGANVNAADSEGCTALHIAVICDRTDLVSALLAAGADSSLVNMDGERPIDLATSQDIKALLQAEN